MSVDPRVIRGVIGKAKLILTERQFEFFQAHYEHELDASEIAHEFGVTETTVYSTLRRAKARMKKEWG